MIHPFCSLRGLWGDNGDMGGEYSCLIAKSSGKFEPERIHGVCMGKESEVVKRLIKTQALKLFELREAGPLEKRFQSSYDSTVVSAPAGGFAGAVSLTAVSWAALLEHRTCLLTLSCRKLQKTNFFIKAMSLIEILDNHLKFSLYWLHSIDMHWLTTFVRINSWPLPRFHWRHWRLCWAQTLGLPCRWLLCWFSRAVPFGEGFFLIFSSKNPFHTQFKTFFQHRWHKKDDKWIGTGDDGTALRKCILKTWPVKRCMYTIIVL